jgi:hypothetical protein
MVQSVNESINHSIISEVREYCEGQTFKAECPENHVILMHSAEYGRMRVGRCIPSDDYGNMGCGKNIITLMDAFCSGRHSCEVSVSSIHDNLRSDPLPCVAQLRGYMEASYSCVKGTIIIRFLILNLLCTTNLPF